MPLIGPCVPAGATGLRVLKIGTGKKTRVPEVHAFLAAAAGAAPEGGGSDGISVVSSCVRVPQALRPVPHSVTPGFTPERAFGHWHFSWGPHQLSPPEPPAYVGVVRDAMLSPLGWVVACGRQAPFFLSPGGCFGETNVPRVPVPPEGTAVVAVPAIVALCDGWAHGYFHFTSEHLPRVALVLPMLLASPSCVVPIPKRAGFARQLLVDVLGLPRAQIVDAHGWYRAATVYYPSPMTCGNAHLHAVLALRSVAFSRLGLPRGGVGPAPKLVPGSSRLRAAATADEARAAARAWAAAGGAAAAGNVTATSATASPSELARQIEWVLAATPLPPDGRVPREEGAPAVVVLTRRGDARLPANFADAVAAIRASATATNAVVIDADFSRIPPALQVRLFNRADVVAGPHGANLSNLMWMRHGALAVEIVPAATGNMCYYTLAARLGVRYAMVFNYGKEQNQKNTVAVPELLLHVERGIAAAGLAW